MVILLQDAVVKVSISNTNSDMILNNPTIQKALESHKTICIPRNNSTFTMTARCFFCTPLPSDHAPAPRSISKLIRQFTALKSRRPSSIPLNVPQIRNKASESYKATCKSLNDPEMFQFVLTTSRCRFSTPRPLTDLLHPDATRTTTVPCPIHLWRLKRLILPLNESYIIIACLVYNFVGLVIDHRKMSDRKMSWNRSDDSNEAVTVMPQIENCIRWFSLIANTEILFWIFALQKWCRTAQSQSLTPVNGVVLQVAHITIQQNTW